MADRKPYRGSSGHRGGRVPYRGSGGQRTARAPYRGEPTTAKAATPPPEKKHHGGFFSTLKHIVTQTPKDLANAAYQAPGGIYAVAKATEEDQLHAARHGDFNVLTALLHGKHTRPIAKGMVKQTVDTVRHPLRHPGDTLLLALPAAGQAAKVAEAGALARAGESASTVTRAATIGAKPGPRILKVGDMEVRGHYSRAAGSRAVQKATDRALQKGAETSLRVENQLHRRAAKFETRNQRTADAVARAPGTRVQALGARLTPAEQRALRLVAEEVPAERRLGAQEMRKARSRSSKEAARHQERIDLTRAAMEHLTADSLERPVFKPESVRLSRVYDAMKKASGNREEILKHLDLMDQASLEASRVKAARLAAGGRYEKPTAAKLGQPSQALIKAQARVDRLQTVFDRMTAEKPISPGEQPRGITTTLPRAERMGGALSVAKDELQRLEQAAAKRVKPTGVVGAEDIQPSPAATFIGNPAEKTKLRGTPRVSSGGTFGHTTKPTSLKVATGGSVEHALERNDVTNIVAERHAEAARLGKIDRLVQRFAKAGEKAPRRKDDVFMWTDRTVSNERIPKEVREYLDNPEAIAKLTPDKRQSAFDKIRDATFDKQDWRDPDKVAEFTKLAEQGKGVFVPKRLLGEFAKRSYSIGDNPLVKTVDAINNAQKVGLIYLKLNYPVIQAMSNTAMNLIQQGPFAVRNLTAAVKLDSKIGEDSAAIVDDIMGQGAVAQAQLEGHGAIARGSHKLADVMGSKVDRPARRAAFYHEALKAGYDTPEKFRALLENDAHAGDLGEVAQRSREAIVDYGDMGPAERNIVRRLVFVYPWQKGAVKYAGNFLRDHPVQAAAVAQLGELGKGQSDRLLGPVPHYLEGLIPAGGGRTMNPAGVNFFQTPAQIGTSVAGFAAGNPAEGSAGLGFLAPAPGVAAGLLSGRDDIGRPLTGNVLAKARDLTLAQTPAAQIGRAALGGNPVVDALLGSRGASKTYPDPNDPFWRFLLGGLYARQTSRPALNQNAAREKTGR